MSDVSFVTPRPSRRRSPGRIGMYGMAFTLLGGVSYFFLLDIPFIRNTAIPNIACVLIGMSMTVLAVFRRRSISTILSAGVSAFVGLGLIGSLFILMKLPPPEAVARTAAELPDFSLKNQLGETVTLSSFRGKGPVLLVFYRGHW